MIHSTTWKKLMTGAIAFTLVTGSAVPVLTANSSIAVAATAGITPFVDVPAGLYAEKHIYRLSLQQIVKGYENKETGTFTFQYNNTISQQEAVIMAIRFAGLESKLNTTDVIVFDENFDVKSDYKPYVELAFEEGLLDRELEYQLAAADTTTEWGTKAASREWVTKLVIKALGAESKAQEMASIATSFADNSNIDSKYLGYVNAAVDLGLIKGLTATTFGPTSPINRASFTTILSRAQKDFPLEVSGQHYGIVTAIGEDSVTLYENGKETTYSTDASTGYYETDNDFAIDRSKLVLYGEAALFAINGTAKFVEAQGNEIFVETINTEVGRVNTTDKTIYVWIDNKPVEIKYDDTVKFVDSSGKTISVSDLKEKDQISILRGTFSESQLPISITLVTSANQSSTYTGKLYSVDSRTITISTDKGYVTKSLAKGYTISIPSIGNAAIKDLVADVDSVTLSANSNDEITSIVVSERNMKTMLQPSIVNFDESKKLITVLNNDGNKAEALFLSDGTRYLMDGKLVTYDVVKSILPSWQNVIVRYSDQGEKNTVIYYDLVSEYTGEVVSINTADREVSFKVEDGSILKMDYFNANVQSLTETSKSYSAVKPGVTMTFALSANENEISTFLLHEKKTLTVSSVSATVKEIGFKDDKNNSYSVLIEEADVKLANGNAATIEDIKSGFKAEVTFAGGFIKEVKLQ